MAQGHKYSNSTMNACIDVRPGRWTEAERHLLWPEGDRQTAYAEREGCWVLFLF